MDKQTVVYSYNGILFSHKKEWIIDICYNMDSCCCSVAKSCLILRPLILDCSTPSLLSSRICSNSGLLSQWCYTTIHLILCHPLLLLPSIFPSIGSFPMSWLFTSGGQSTETSASVLPMNIQDWFPLGSIDLISLLSNRLLRIFSSTTIWDHQFFSAQPSLTPICDYWKNHNFYYMDSVHRFPGYYAKWKKSDYKRSHNIWLCLH